MSKERKLSVEEFPHAYVVWGTSYAPEAREFLISLFGEEARRLPLRPMHFKGRSCTAAYFAMGKGGDQKYGPLERRRARPREVEQGSKVKRKKKRET